LVWESDDVPELKVKNNLNKSNVDMRTTADFGTVEETSQDVINEFLYKELAMILINKKEQKVADE
jgi:hypothetical protein